MWGTIVALPVTEFRPITPALRGLETRTPTPWVCGCSWPLTLQEQLEAERSPSPFLLPKGDVARSSPGRSFVLETVVNSRKGVNPTRKRKLYHRITEAWRGGWVKGPSKDPELTKRSSQVLARPRRMPVLQV